MLVIKKRVPLFLFLLLIVLNIGRGRFCNLKIFKQTSKQTTATTTKTFAEFSWENALLFLNLGFAINKMEQTVPS